MKAIGYIRVSTKDQVDNGESLRNQKERIRKYAEYMEFELIDIKSDPGITGFKKNVVRPQYNKIAEMVKNKEVDHVIAYSMSRFSRNATSTLLAIQAMEECGVTFHSVSEGINTSTAMGRTFTKLLSIFAEMESENISERVRSVKETSKKNLRRYSSPIFGFNNTKDLEVNPTEMSVVREIHQLKSQNLSSRKIAAQLTSKGVVAKEGKPFIHTSIVNILKNPIYSSFLGNSQN